MAGQKTVYFNFKIVDAAVIKSNIYFTSTKKNIKEYFPRN